MRWRTPCWLLAVLVLASGCAQVPYRFGQGLEGEHTLALQAGEAQIERGRPHALVDALGHYLLSLPTKLLLLSWKVDNHDLSPETEAALRQYLDENGLAYVKVRVNQYAPGDEWRRLFANQDVHALWRYTAGILTVTAYTLFPQRLFGGDNYNPFTNTVSLYSDHRAIALHEAGHAKDFAGARNKGTYAVLRLLPLVPLFQEAEATGDAIGYERVRGGSQDEKRAYRILYPAYGTYVGGEASRWIPGPAWLSYAITYGMAVPGHVVGWVRSAFVEERPRPDPELWQIPEPTEPPQPSEARNEKGAALLARTAFASGDSR